MRGRGLGEGDWGSGEGGWGSGEGGWGLGEEGLGVLDVNNAPPGTTEGLVKGHLQGPKPDTRPHQMGN